MKKRTLTRILFSLLSLTVSVGLLACGGKEKKATGDTMAADEVAVIKTDYGRIVLEFFIDDTPLHANNFKKLANSDFYNGMTFHRVIRGFMIQGGDPNSKDDDRANDGLGGLGYTLPAEIKRRHHRGVIAAARKPDQMNPGRRSSACQFYITVAPKPYLDGQYTVFGRVIEGMEVVDKISKVRRDARDNPLKKQVMKKVYVTKRKDL